MRLLKHLKNGRNEVDEMVKSYRRRRNYIVQSFNEIGLSCHHPGGAFYAFPSIQSTGLSSQEFAEALLEQENVAVVPGDVFGESGEGHIRCSYATSMEQIQEAMKRIRSFVTSSITKGMKKGQPIKGCPFKKGGILESLTL